MTAGLRTAVALATLLPLVATLASETPQPLPGNPPPQYPAEAYDATVEGEASFRATVGPDGGVLAVEVIETPQPGAGFEQAVRDAVSQWRFAPATRDGHAVEGIYDGTVNFEVDFPLHAVRMYPVTHEVVWQALAETMEELGFRPETMDAENGVYITRQRTPTERTFPGLDLLESKEWRPGFAKFYAFVSPFVEPARLHIGSTLVIRKGFTERTLFNAGIVERWLFGRIEERLGLPGHAVPVSAVRRAELARRLLPEHDFGGCRPEAENTVPHGDLLRQILDQRQPADGVTNPQLIRETRLEPMYPEDARARRESGSLLLAARISEDGSIISVWPIEASDIGEEFVTSAAESVSLWRYRPATRQGCPVQVYFTIFAEFRLR